MPLFGIDGIVSGLKTSEIIDQLMAIERQPLQALQSQRDLIDQRRTIVLDVQQRVSSLQQLALQLALRNTVNAKTATTDTPPTDPPILVAKASADAATGSFLVTVKQLATATRVTSSSPDGTTVAAIGQAVNPTAVLASAGFGVTPTTGTFTINGVQITIDADDKLDDPADPANSVVEKINAAGAGVTASLVNDAYGRPNLLRLVSDSGRGIRLGASGDTSNFLTAVGLMQGAVVGNTATTVTGSSVGAGAISATITINGRDVVINQTDAGFTAAQNAAFIRDALNAAGLDVTASVTGAGNDQIVLTQQSLGSQYTIAVAVTGADAAKTGLTAGTYQNGTDAVVSAGPIGRLNTTGSLGSNTFTTPLLPDAGGGGTIRINGVDVAWSASESLNAILSRINASGTGVLATYDALTDKVTLTATQTGGAAVALEDVSGNLLEALHILKDPTTSVPQQLGQNAIVNIEGVNNGQDIVSASNTISGYVSGITLDLKRASAAPVTVTVSQDTGTTIQAVKSWIEAVNALFDKIAEVTKADPDPKKAGPLAGDSGMLGIDRSLRTLIASPAIGATGKYRTLADVGITTGAIGSAVGTTNHLQLDEAKLTAALQDNPAAVETLFAGLLANLGPVTRTSGSGDAIISASGMPTDHHLDGTYVITILDTAGNAQVEFRANDGRVLFQRSATLSPNATDGTLIPGVTLTTGGSIQPGTFEFTVSWGSKGVMVGVNDYLKDLLGVDGLFDARQESADTQLRDLDRRIQDLQARLDQRQEALYQKFAQLEATLASLQAQSAQINAQILRFAGS